MKSSPSRKSFWPAVVLVVGVGAAGLWVISAPWRKAGFEWRLFGAVFLHLDPLWLAASCAVNLLTYYARALRWAVMLKPLQPHPNLWRITKANVIGFMAVTLLGRPGEFVRPYLISLREKVPFSSQLAAWLLERLCDLLCLVLLFGLALTRVDSTRPSLQRILQTGGWTVALVGAACLLVFVLLRNHVELMRRCALAVLTVLPRGRREWAGRMVETFLAGTACTRTLASMGLLILYTVLDWFLVALSFACLVLAFHLRFGWQEVLILTGFVCFGGVFQIPGVGGGMQVAAVLALTQVLGQPLEVASGMALVIWAISIATIVPPGLLLAFHEGLNWKKLKRLEEDAAALGEAPAPRP